MCKEQTRRYALHWLDQTKSEIICYNFNPLSLCYVNGNRNFASYISLLGDFALENFRSSLQVSDENL